MRKIVISRDEYKQEKETRTYEITAKPYQLNLLEEFLSMLKYCGDVGASRALQIFVDGDGSAQFGVVRKDGVKLRQPPEDINTDDDPVKLRGID